MGSPGTSALTTRITREGQAASQRSQPTHFSVPSSYRSKRQHAAIVIRQYTLLVRILEGDRFVIEQMREGGLHAHEKFVKRQSLHPIAERQIFVWAVLKCATFMPLRYRGKK